MRDVQLLRMVCRGINAVVMLVLATVVCILLVVYHLKDPTDDVQVCPYFPLSYNLVFGKGYCSTRTKIMLRPICRPIFTYYYYLLSDMMPTLKNGFGLPTFAKGSVAR